MAMICFPNHASAKNSLAQMTELLSKLDDRTAGFVMNLMMQKEEMIENDKNFEKAKSYLPVTYENYQLRDMEKSDHELMLFFNTTDPKVPELWKKDQNKFKLKFYKGVCKGFKKYNFRKIDEITISIEFEGKVLTTLNQKKDSCNK